MDKQKIKDSAIEAIETEQIPDRFTGRIRIDIECNEGGVRDVSIERKRRIKK
jgi:hypothetical protein